MVVRKKSLITTYVEGMTKWSQDRIFFETLRLDFNFMGSLSGRKKENKSTEIPRMNKPNETKPTFYFRINFL